MDRECGGMVKLQPGNSPLNQLSTKLQNAHECLLQTSTSHRQATTYHTDMYQSGHTISVSIKVIQEVYGPGPFAGWKCGITKLCPLN